MRPFTPDEIAYMSEPKLGRLATVDAEGRPHITPVGFRHNADLGTIDIGGRDPLKTKKWRDVVATGKAAFVVDDVLPPWRPRGIEVRGRAEAIAETGVIRITPTRIVSWGMDQKAEVRSSAEAT